MITVGGKEKSIIQWKFYSDNSARKSYQNFKEFDFRQFNSLYNINPEALSAEEMKGNDSNLTKHYLNTVKLS